MTQCSSYNNFCRLWLVGLVQLSFFHLSRVRSKSQRHIFIRASCQRIYILYSLIRYSMSVREYCRERDFTRLLIYCSDGILISDVRTRIQRIESERETVPMIREEIKIKRVDSLALSSVPYLRKGSNKGSLHFVVRRCRN
jgi:hypothetical protein